MPSEDELEEMYNAIGPGTAVPDQGFDDTRAYWSSTEFDADNVVVVNFPNGNVLSNPKTFSRNTRAIRTILDP